jgi:hypothetical protein
MANYKTAITYKRNIQKQKKLSTTQTSAKFVNRKIRVKVREFSLLYRLQFRFGGCDGCGENDNDDSKIL